MSASQSETCALAAGQRLAKMRNTAKLSREQLDLLLGVPPGRVARWEEGKDLLTEAWALMVIGRIAAYGENPVIIGTHS